MKILHLAPDEKFIDMGLRSFEEIYPQKNSVIVFSNNPIKLVKSIGVNCKRVNPFNRFNPFFLFREIRKYDIVVLHSLSDWFLPIILFSPKKTSFIWLGWGYDYYRFINGYKADEQLEPITAMSNVKTNVSLIRVFSNILKYPFTITFVIKYCIKKIKIFSPVLPEEYEMLKKSILMENFPKYVPWNYGCLEKDLLLGFSEEKISGENILIGNSAAITNNHLDTFNLLCNINLDNVKLVTPLSYGDLNYAGLVISEGYRIFGDKFEPLNKFIDLGDYINIIKSCGFVIMNHKRQQALGNIVIMLYLGAVVFLNGDSPAYRYLKNLGVLIFSLDDLEEDSLLLTKKLTENEILINREKLKLTWSHIVISQRTKYLVESMF